MSGTTIDYPTHMNSTTPSIPLKNRPDRRSLAACAGLALTLLGLQTASAQQALPFYEPFPGTYVNGEYLGSNTGVSGSTSGGTSGINWNFGNSLSSSCARVENYAALEYPSLVNTDATAQSFGLSSYYKDTSSTKDRGASLTITAGQTLYASCLINVQSNNILSQTFPAPFFGLSPSSASAGSSVSQSGAVAYFNAAGQLQIAKNSSTPATNTTYSLTTSNTHLVVIRYKYNPGAPDEVDLWLDPTALGNNGIVPAPTISTTNNANVTSFGSVAYYQLGAPSVFYLDEVRVGYNWADVTPTNAAPGKIYAVSGGGSGCAGDNFSINLSGSDSGLTYNLYTNGAPNGSTVNGTGAAIAFTGQNATALYTVLATNTTTGAAAWMSGSAAITVLSLPNIATQPAPAVATTNGVAAFNVYSAGSGLNYQWYRNGVALTDGGHISGSQTATLVINPATTADAATKANGYFVIVANRCGNGVVSITNSLTLDTAASLVWYGDGNSNSWDVATSSNWNYNATLGYSTNVFNFGDNVTFDDTSANTTVNLNNANLSPSSVTINGAGGQSYTLTGGTLVGSGAIYMNSLASLNLDILNNSTGGLIISNGIVAFGTPAALGFGPINLAGGQLSQPGIGLVIITNSIVVTGSNSVIGVNSPGGQQLEITSPLVGLGGTLTLENITTKNAATASAEFTATNINFGLPVDLNIGSGSIFLAGFNTSGTQTWSGNITDAGGVWRDGSGGTTILNNTNSYSGETKLTGGSLGLGSSSVQSLPTTLPPTIYYGPLGIGTLTIDSGTAAVSLFASGGPQNVANPINYDNTNTSVPLIINGANSLNLSGPFDLSGTNRVIEVDSSADTTLSGDITDDGEVFGFTKTGTGSLYLDATNDFTGDLTNSAGLLAGSGTVTGPVVVLSGATLGAGDDGVIPGTLTLNGGLTLNGNIYVRVNKSQAQSNDVIAVTGTLANTGTGTVTVANVGTALKVGDSFTLFSQPVTGSGLTVSGGGVTWNNHLTVDGGITVATIVPTTPPVFFGTVLSGTNIVSGVSNAPAGSTYYVLATTNLTLPRASWTPIATNTYPSGVFYLTNHIVPGVPTRYYQLSPNP